MAILCAGCVLLGAVDAISAALVPRRDGAQLAYMGGGLFAAGLISAVPILPAARRRLARVLPIDPASMVHMVALTLSVLLVGFQLVTQLTTDVLAQEAASGQTLTPFDLIVQEIPFLIIALAGVGIFLRRTPREAIRRLGIVRPRLWQIGLGLAAAGAFYALGIGFDALGQLLTPSTAQKVNAANQRIFGGLGDAAGIATLALAAGICEETLFRGAIQPRLGIIWTSLVFASVHTQYGLSFDALAVFVLACGLGLLRRYANTTTSMISHIAYNSLVGIGLAGTALYAGIGVEAVLAVTLGVALVVWLRRRPGVPSQAV